MSETRWEQRQRRDVRLVGTSESSGDGSGPPITTGWEPAQAGMDAQMNKWKDRRRQKSSVIIRAAGTMCWKHLDGKRYHRQHQQLGWWSSSTRLCWSFMWPRPLNLRVDGRPGPQTCRVVTALTLNTTMQLYQRSLCGFLKTCSVLIESTFLTFLWPGADGVSIHCDTWPK